MQKINKKAFTLVELLVVITILAIISVVAYQSFGGATDKAINSRKISDISTIESGLQNFKSSNSYYPIPMTYNSGTNIFGYDSTKIALATNKLVVDYDKAEILTVSGAISLGGGKVMGINSLSGSQVGAKGTIGLETSESGFNKKYLTKDLYDPEIGDTSIKDENKKMIDRGVGRYIYAVYAKPATSSWNSSSATASYYNLATTVKDTTKTDMYKAYIVGDYDQNSCNTPSDCPNTLIGSGTGVLINNEEQDSIVTDITNQGVPYLTNNFPEN